jgi:hypothetical protein
LFGNLVKIAVDFHGIFGIIEVLSGGVFAGCEYEAGCRDLL